LDKNINIVPKNGNPTANGLNHISSAGGGMQILLIKSNGASIKTKRSFYAMFISFH